MKYLLAVLLVLPTITFSQLSDTTISSQPLGIPSGSNDAKVYDIVGVSPQYPGGPTEMAKFIQENFEYPEEARELGEQGTVWIEFVVEKDSLLTNIKVVKSVSESLDSECIRVISIMPNWGPGEHAGKPVSVRYTIPIKAKIAPQKKKKKLFKRN